jgi:predicted  nucleic acid-binding Zn-ribbon protein
MLPDSLCKARRGVSRKSFSWKAIQMASKLGFPLEDLKSDVARITSALSKAEDRFSQDKDLADAIKGAKDSAEKLEKELKSDR